MSLRAGGGGVRKRRWSNGSKYRRNCAAACGSSIACGMGLMCRRRRRSPPTARIRGSCSTMSDSRSKGGMVLNWRGPLLAGAIFAAVFAILLLMAHQNQSTTGDMGSSLREDPYGTSLLFDSYARAGYQVKRSQDEDSLSDQNADRTTAFFIGGSPYNDWESAKGKLLNGGKFGGRLEDFLARGGRVLLNEAIKTRPNPVLLDFLTGGRPVIWVDETLHGLHQDQGVLWLVQRYRLQVALMLFWAALLALLWSMSGDLLRRPRRDQNAQIVRHGESAGVASRHLLQRSIPTEQVVAECWEQYRRRSPQDAQAISADAHSGPRVRAALAQPALAGYKELSQLIAERRATAKGLAQADRLAP